MGQITNIIASRKSRTVVTFWQHSTAQSHSQPLNTIRCLGTILFQQFSLIRVYQTLAQTHACTACIHKMHLIDKNKTLLFKCLWPYNCTQTNHNCAAPWKFTTYLSHNGCEVIATFRFSKWWPYAILNFHLPHGLGSQSAPQPFIRSQRNFAETSWVFQFRS